VDPAALSRRRAIATVAGIVLAFAAAAAGTALVTRLLTPGPQTGLVPLPVRGGPPPGCDFVSRLKTRPVELDVDVGDVRCDAALIDTAVHAGDRWFAVPGLLMGASWTIDAQSADRRSLLAHADKFFIRTDDAGATWSRMLTPDDGGLHFFPFFEVESDARHLMVGWIETQGSARCAGLELSHGPWGDRVVRAWNRLGGPRCSTGVWWTTADGGRTWQRQ
jgi:hypothetical protein